jgi:hypothetical protein
MPDPTTTISTGKPDATEIGHVRFGKGLSEKDPNDGHLVGDLLHRTAGSAGGRTEKDLHHRHLAVRPTLKVAGQWVYLYRAIDQYGQVIDVLVSEKRDLAATRRFLPALSNTARDLLR